MTDRPRPDGSDVAVPGAPPVDEANLASTPRLIDRIGRNAITRRDVLRCLGLGAVGVSAASLLDACSPAATAAPPATSAAAPPAHSQAAAALFDPLVDEGFAAVAIWGVAGSANRRPGTDACSSVMESSLCSPPRILKEIERVALPGALTSSEWAPKPSSNVPSGSNSGVWVSMAMRASLGVTVSVQTSTNMRLRSSKS